jgi:hypothetical protein
MLVYADIEHPAVSKVDRLWINSLPDRRVAIPGAWHP